ncbi:MAG: hypothetical protein IPH24_14655 [Crocinitomicaceae bacterium]|jgi:hypothetical protein|nr:hypothetical protein [Crocinitomicaceae bacterium]
MILLKNSVNTVSLTLVEKTTLPNPYYLFEFQNIYTRKKYFQIFTDVSVSGEARTRANEFNIEVVDSGSGANKIILGDIGQYNYTIYEQVSDSNLNPANTTSIVERREMRLLDSEATIYVEHEIEIEYTTHEQ